MAQTALNGRVVFEDSGDYDAVDFRKLIQDNQIGPGSVDYNSLLPGVVSGLTMSFQPGASYVRQPGDGTLYRCTQEGSAATIALNTNGSGNPRIDQLVLHVYDASAAGDSSAVYLAAIENVDGTPTSGATLDNRSGAADLQTTFATSLAHVLLADVLMPAGASTVSAGNVRDRRKFALKLVPGNLNATGGGGPGTGASVDAVVPEFYGGLRLARYVTDTTVAAASSAALMWIPRRIPATHLKWLYVQGGVSGDGLHNTTSAYRFAIADASGRIIASTASQALSGADGNSTMDKLTLSVPYTGYVFDVGPHYLFFGLAGISSGNAVYYKGVVAGGVNGGVVATGELPPHANIFVYDSAAAGLPASGTIKGMTDIAFTGRNSLHLPVPLVALTIG